MNNKNNLQKKKFIWNFVSIMTKVAWIGVREARNRYAGWNRMLRAHTLCNKQEAESKLGVVDSSSWSRFQIINFLLPGLAPKFQNSVTTWRSCDQNPLSLKDICYFNHHEDHLAKQRPYSSKLYDLNHGFFLLDLLYHAWNLSYETGFMSKQKVIGYPNNNQFTIEPVST